jgi:ABC-2 type transport system permease protein
VSSPATVAWLARHELRLSWREWTAMVTGGKRSRAIWLIAAAAVFAVVLHLLAYVLIAPFASTAHGADVAALVVVTGCAALAGSLMLSQAVEMLTRVFYARADLDLLLASPVSAGKLFTVRILAIALSTTLMAAPLAAPLINALAYAGGLGWLTAYGLIAALGATAAAVGVVLTVTLFRVLGAKRTRLAAQIVAAVIGAAFVIGIQAVAILAAGSLSRFAAMRSEVVLRHAPDPGSLVWLPARAAMGDMQALLWIAGLSAGMLAVAILMFAREFADHAGAAAGATGSGSAEGQCTRGMRIATPAQALRRKEWVLLRRDPWLLSQTLMQLLYLLPPALMLWRSFGEDAGASVVLAPVLVMGAGQLAGGLAWLAVSGEDAPDLVDSAPVQPRQVLRAKIEAVLAGVALPLLPFIVALSWTWPWTAVVASIGAAIAAASATLIQLWFRKQAKRSHFRRRQTSSRLATFAEAFTSICWAGTAGLAVAGSWLALIPAGFAMLILAGVRWIRPAT